MPLTTWGTALCRLPDWSILQVTGEDAATFLQGLSTCDVLALAVGASSCGAFCTPKGRVIANFRIARHHDGFQLWLAADLAETVRKRLQMFVLRSRVSLEVLDRQLRGAFGPGIEAALAAAGLALEAKRGATAAVGLSGVSVLRLDDDRFCLAMESGHTALLDRLITHCLPVHPDAWRLRDIAAGFPWVISGTREEFLPQMLNLDLLGGIGFKKGCYTGQEIVTRTHYLGQLKRRLFRLHATGESTPEPGARVFDTTGAEPKTAGQIVNACRHPDGGWECLAVLALELAESPNLRASDPQGPPLTLRPLPYPLSQSC